MKKVCIFIASLMTAFQCCYAQFGQFGPMPSLGAPAMNQSGPSSVPSMPAFNHDFMQQFGLHDEEFHGAENSEEPDSGNWYEKLHWWKEAKRVYTIDIHDAMEELKKIMQDYEEKKKTTYAQIESVIASLPVTPSVAEPRINTELADVRKQRDQLLENTAQDNRMALSHIEDLEKTLEALKADFQNIATLQSRAKEAFEMYAKSIKDCENYEERALDYFERIEKVLDDKKAHDYYDMVENSLDNIKAIMEYLSGPLLIYIDQVAGQVQILAPKAKKTVEDLEKKVSSLEHCRKKKKPSLLFWNRSAKRLS